MLVIVDATTLTLGTTGTGVKFRPEGVLEVDVEVNEVLVAVEDEVGEDVVAVVLWEAAEEAVLEAVAAEVEAEVVEVAVAGVVEVVEVVEATDVDEVCVHTSQMQAFV